MPYSRLLGFLSVAFVSNKSTIRNLSTPSVLSKAGKVFAISPELLLYFIRLILLRIDVGT